LRHGADVELADLVQAGVVDSDLIIAKAKTEEAETLDEAFEFLTPAEMRSLLPDPEGFQLLLVKLE